MIAKLTFRFNGKSYEATVKDDRRWSCDDSWMEDVLNMLFDPKKDGPSSGYPGACAARAAAFFMDGHATFLPRPPAQQGVVY